MPFARTRQPMTTRNELAQRRHAPADDQIGQAIGKPYRRRSWIARVLRGTP